MSLHQVMGDALDGLLIRPLQDLILQYIPITIIRSLPVARQYAQSIKPGLGYLCYEVNSKGTFTMEVPFGRMLRSEAYLDPSPILPAPGSIFYCPIDLSFFDGTYTSCDIEIDIEFGTVLNVINKQ